MRKDPAKAYADTGLIILNALLAVFWYILAKSPQGYDNAVTLVALSKGKSATRRQTKDAMAAKR